VVLIVYPVWKKGNGVAMEQATFGAGCFWGVEAEFRHLTGVVETSVGYTGGHLVNPTYEDVCSGSTGHAEVVRVVFDPTQISYEALLAAFWTIHDPTQLNRQGPDVGDQYRTVIFVHDDGQKLIAEDSLAQLSASGKVSGSISTTIELVRDYWLAEDYHQQFLEKRRSAGFGH
jgi:peptide-methionine (S)-S-oxide reductase